jgi:hypothetical protein
MEQSGRNPWQPVANENDLETAKTSQTVAVGLVKRGSTVRVRQRALQKPAKRRFFSRVHLRDPQRAVGMEPVMEPAGREASPSGTENGHIAIRRYPPPGIFSARCSVATAPKAA